MNVWCKPRLQSVDNIIKTHVLGGEVSSKQIDAVHDEALEAKRNIAAYLGEQLADLIEHGNVVVMI